MTRLSIAPASADDARIGGFLDRQKRRVDAMPPGMCPLAQQLTLLEEGALQTCGKCVPCRDGLPQLAEMLRHLVDCQADAAEVERMRALAEMVRDTSDCAIGYESANALLEGLDAFAAEVESHVSKHECQRSVGQSVPCETFCPAHVNVPAYIALVAQGDYAGAVQMIRKDNPFPTACGLVCEHPCEQRCRRTLIDAPLNIRGIKEFACEHARADQVPVPKRLPATGRRVAVVGGGPSGLTCAYFAALMGHDVDVFEGRKQLGGMIRYGIPAYRFPRERLDEDIRGILAVGGITVHTESPVDAERMAQLSADYDAVYVAIGAQTGKGLRIDGTDAEGVFSAVGLLGRIGDGDYPDFTGKKVAVIGGGNTAIDSARTAVRLGAKEVVMLYRRTEEDMPADKVEIKDALEEGVKIRTLVNPTDFVGIGGKLNSICIMKQKLGQFDSSGRRKAVPSGETYVEEFDVVIPAISQTPDTKFIKGTIQLNGDRVVADRYTQATSMPGVFVGGDAHRGPKDIVNAVHEAKVAASGIDKYLGGSGVLYKGFEQEITDYHIEGDIVPHDRFLTRQIEAEKAVGSFCERNLGMHELDARAEASRCLRCDRR